MYSSPFGSIFGDKILKPAAQPKVKDSELSPQDSLAAQTVDLKTLQQNTEFALSN